MGEVGLFERNRKIRRRYHSLKEELEGIRAERDELARHLARPEDGPRSELAEAGPIRARLLKLSDLSWRKHEELCAFMEDNVGSLAEADVEGEKLKIEAHKLQATLSAATIAFVAALQGPLPPVESREGTLAAMVYVLLAASTFLSLGLVHLRSLRVGDMFFHGEIQSGGRGVDLFYPASLGCYCVGSLLFLLALVL